MSVTPIHLGARFCAQRFRDGDPFTLVRYGAGEWMIAVPDLPEWRKRVGPSSQVPSPLWTIWHRESSCRILRESILATPRSPRYWPAIWHLDGLRRKGWLGYVMDWIEENELDTLTWRFGTVWQRAVRGDSMGCVVDALRGQSLPLVLIGPDYLAPLSDYLPIHTHIPTHMLLCPTRDVFLLRERIVGGIRPAVYMFSAGAVGKILIQQLFPLLGEESFLVDFGACWDGYCGVASRGYHKRITGDEVKATFGGRGNG